MRLHFIHKWIKYGLEPRGYRYICLKCPKQKVEHSHDWVYVTRTSWRDRYDKGKYMLEFYICECGAGHREYVPWESYEL
jgi:hypothetical protein